MSKPVDAIEFKQIKHKLKWRQSIPKLLAHEVGRSEATVTRIKASKNFEEFQQLSNAEHPPLRPTTIGKKFSRLLGVLKKKDIITKDDERYINTGKRNDDHR